MAGEEERSLFRSSSLDGSGGVCFPRSDLVMLCWECRGRERPEEGTEEPV